MEIRESMESYYTVLGVGSDSSLDQIRRSYRKLAMQWHPDRWARTPSLLGEAKRKFQKIQEAYSVLSDPAKRAAYDARLYDEYDEDFCDFMEEMFDLMGQVKEEEKGCSLEEVQSMFAELSRTFDSPQWFSNLAPANNRACSSTGLYWTTNPTSKQMSGVHVNSDLGVFGISSHCR